MEKFELPGAKEFETNVPYIVHESDMARLAHTNELLLKVNHRQHIVIISLIVLIWAMIVAFFIYETISTCDYTTETISQEVVQDTEGGGENNFHDNNLIVKGENNGEADSKNDTGEDNNTR